MTAPLYGLVLRGGKSRRMGRDKAALVYHEQPEAERMFGLLATVCERSYYSVAFGTPDQAHTIPDLEPDQGPVAGLRAAARRFPDAAWLVVACDMPRFDQAALAELVAARNARSASACSAAGGSTASFAATAFIAGDGRPHPLAAIYEPAAQAAFEEGSPRRVLERIAQEQACAQFIPPSDPAWLESFDTPEQSAAFEG